MYTSRQRPKDPPKAHNDQDEPMLPDNPPLRILLIDDDENYFIYLSSLIEQLTEPRCHLAWCASFAAGQAALAHPHYDFCLLDYQLDTGNGLELLTQLRAHNSHLPVLLITASEDRAVYEQAMTLGISGYLLKYEVTPFLLERSLRLALQLTPAATTPLTYDTLTGLPDHNTFYTQLHDCLRTLAADTCCAVLLCKLTRVQLHNDSLDPDSGKHLLKVSADRLRQQRPANALAARCGDDELAVLLPPPLNNSVVQQLAESLSEHLDQPLPLTEHILTPGLRIGIALATGSDTPAQVLANARLALQQPQQPPYRRWALFDPVQRIRINERLQLEQLLLQGIEKQEFILHYQPLIAAATQRVTGFEALLRWHNAERGNILPATFIPIAEESGLIVPLGWWVLETAAHDLQRLQQCSTTPLSVSINLSARQLVEPELLPRIEDLLQRTALAPGWLTLEITETALLQHTDLAITKLKVLKVLGVECHIDDFGTGYSSLSHVQQLPSTALKIDRSFVSGMLHDPAHRAIVETIINLAHRLDKIVIAEGIETREQYELLRTLHCNWLQGYWLSLPMTCASAAHWLHHMQEKIDNLLTSGPDTATA